MTKQMLIAKVKDITEMSSVELEKFKKQVAMSNIDDKTRFYLYEAIDERHCQIKRDLAMIEDGEIKAGEI